MSCQNCHRNQDGLITRGAATKFDCSLLLMSKVAGVEQQTWDALLWPLPREDCSRRSMHLHKTTSLFWELRLPYTLFRKDYSRQFSCHGQLLSAVCQRHCDFSFILFGHVNLARQQGFKAHSNSNWARGA